MGSLQNLNENSIVKRLHCVKSVVFILTIFIILDILVCAFFYWHENQIELIDISELDRLTEEDGVKYAIDECSLTINENNNKVLSVVGWVFISGIETKNVGIHCIITDTKEGNSFVLPTAIVQRADVTEVFNDGNNYDYSGFSVHLNGCKFFDEDLRYQISLLYQIDDREYFISTDTFL